MLRNQLVNQPRERSLVMMTTLLIHQITILRTMIQMMKKNMTTMKTMTMMDDVDDVGKLPADRSPRQRMAQTTSTRSSSNKNMKRA